MTIFWKNKERATNKDVEIIKAFKPIDSNGLTCICGEPPITATMHGKENTFTLSLGKKVCMPFCGDGYCEGVYIKSFFRHQREGKNFKYYEVLVKRAKEFLMNPWAMNGAYEHVYDENNDPVWVSCLEAGSSMRGCCEHIERINLQTRLADLKDKYLLCKRFTVEGPAGDWSIDGKVVNEFRKLIENNTKLTDVRKLVRFLSWVIIHQKESGLTWLIHILDHEARRLLGTLEDYER
jgi:hypothetical protein